jgi:hypothetical protein
LKGRQKVDTTTQQIRLKAGLAIEGDKTAFDRTAIAPALLDNADAIVGDVTNPQREDGEQEKEANHPHHEIKQNGNHSENPFRSCAPVEVMIPTTHGAMAVQLGKAIARHQFIIRSIGFPDINLRVLTDWLTVRPAILLKCENQNDLATNTTFVIFAHN